MSKKKNSGFSLIELMIVVAVIAILFAVALPNYRQHILRSNRSVGQAELMSMAARQEQYFSNNKTYTTSLTELGYPASHYVNEKGEQTSSGFAVYQMTISASGTATSFELSATPQNAQVKDTDCSELTLDNLGNKTSTGGGDRCWS